MKENSTSSVVHSGKILPLRAYLNPLTMVRNLWAHRELIWQLAKRQVHARYRTATLGLLWSVLTPLSLLAIYTFVFTVVFRGTWRDVGSAGRGEFALAMFCGMLVYNLFAEVANNAPGMVVGNPNYVKKVVFPLEVFVPAGLIAALINMALGYLVWLVGYVVVMQTWLSWPAVLFPILLVPVILTTLGVAWFLAALGVFFRDVGHAVLILTHILFFMTPIFYSIQRVPYPFRHVLEINPLAHVIGDVRKVLMWNEWPTPDWFVFSTVASVLLAVLGYAFFMKSKRAFADVV